MPIDPNAVRRPAGPADSGTASRPSRVVGDGELPAITIDGSRAAALERDLIRFDVREDARGPARMEAAFSNWGASATGNGFAHFDRHEIDFGKNIELAIGSAHATTTIFSGVILGIGATYPAGSSPELTIVARDQLALLGFRRRTRVFEGRTDADMIATIAGDLNLQPLVDVPGPTYAQHLQVNETDLDLLRERADATDATVRLTGRRLSAVNADTVAAPAITLAYGTGLLDVTAFADLEEQRTEVRVHGWDAGAKRAIHQGAGSTAVRAAAGSAGRIGPEILAQIVQDATDDIHLEMPATDDEARARARSAMARRARAFVRVQGTAVGTPQLRAGVRVRLTGLGEWFAAEYRVGAVRHTFDRVNGYRTHFEAARAAIGMVTT